MDLCDDNVMELLDWQPDCYPWQSEWMALYQSCPEGGWSLPMPEWIDWAREILSRPLDSYGEEAIARILFVAEPLHGQGMDRRRLQDALLALGRLHGRDYYPADGRVDLAEKNGVIRIERVDLWRPGMASGSSWQAFCQLTLYGKSLVKAEAMPSVFTPSEPEPKLLRRPPTPVTKDWFQSVRDHLAKEASQPSALGKTSAIADDFVWAGPFVDQQVRKFFHKHWDEYVNAVQAVINEQMTMEQFSLDFGPKRISGWINDILNVSEQHPNPCSKQNINPSATYGVLVKAFKRNPREHRVVQQLQQGRSDEAQGILDEFLSEARCGW